MHLSPHFDVSSWESLEQKEGAGEAVQEGVLTGRGTHKSWLYVHLSLLLSVGQRAEPPTAPSMVDSPTLMALSHFGMFGVSNFPAPDRDKHMCTLEFSEVST